MPKLQYRRKSRFMSKVSPPRERSYYKSQVAYLQAQYNYNLYLRAKWVWRHISPGERRAILKSFGYKGYEGLKADLLNDKRNGYDLSALRIGLRELRLIDRYPRSDPRQRIFRIQTRLRPPAPEVLVMKHERRLQQLEKERGVRLGRRRDGREYYVRGLVPTVGRGVPFVRGMVVTADSREDARRKFKHAVAPDRNIHARATRSLIKIIHVNERD